MGENINFVATYNQVIWGYAAIKFFVQSDKTILDFGADVYTIFYIPVAFSPDFSYIKLPPKPGENGVCATDQDAYGAPHFDFDLAAAGAVDLSSSGTFTVAVVPGAE